MTNKQHSINYTISKGIYGRNNQCGAKGERMLFFTQTDCYEPLVQRAFCAVTFLLLYFVRTFIITWVSKNTLDSISHLIPSSLPKATWSNKILVDIQWSLSVFPLGFSCFLKETIFVLQITEQPFRGTKPGRLNATLCQTRNVPVKMLLQ